MNLHYLTKYILKFESYKRNVGGKNILYKNLYKVYYSAQETKVPHFAAFSTFHLNINVNIVYIIELFYLQFHFFLSQAIL